ncbi:MAG: hypothetical protein IPO58_21700 [Betaproteobacteria bacterium]|nr:hypothetical protein [Betaproteobacteria bacterium]
MLLLAALTTSDRDQARQLVAEAAALMDAFGGPGMALGEAAAKLRAALQINPDEPAAHLELARLAMKSGGGLEPPTLAFAEASIRRALAIDPGYGNAFVLLGYVLTHGRRLKEADAAFVEAERAGATSPWLEYNIAELRERQGQSQVAAELMTQVAAAQAKSNGVRSSALQWLQSFHTYAHDYDQADLAYRRQIELSSVAPWPMGNYSRFLRVRRLDTAGSERYARQALAIMEYGMARDSLAAALYLQWAELRASGKNPERANALFAEAARLNPDLSELVSEIGYYPRAHPILDALVAKGISLDTLPGIAGGTTPLSIAAGNRSPALVSQMMTLGANPNTAGYAGMTPLMLAAQRGDERWCDCCSTEAPTPRSSRATAGTPNGERPN